MDYTKASTKPKTKLPDDSNIKGAKINEIPVFMPGNNRDWREIRGMARITAEGDISVRLKDRKDALELIRMWDEGILWQLSFDYKMTPEQIEELNKHAQPEVKEQPVVPEVSDEKKTIAKVKRTLVEGGFTEKGADNLVKALRDNGVLFREKVK